MLEEIDIKHGNLQLKGMLEVPANTHSLVLFAHGSGSSRFSSRNQYVAKVLHQQKIATLLFDLLTEDEDRVDEVTREFRFNIPLLTERLLIATQWVLQQSKLKNLSLGYFGASTGAAAALMAAAQEPDAIKAVVSRGGRPDLAGKYLPYVKTPTLLIVGGNDVDVIELNQAAMTHMQCETKLEIVPHATHLFEEHGTLEKAATLAANWFVTYLK